MDYSNMSQGYFMVKSYLGDTKVKVLVNVAGSKQYQYTLDRGDVYTVIPLSEGNGTYAVEVYENVYDQQYSPILSQNLEVTLDDEFLPFLYPSQYVNFNLENQAIAEAQRLIEGATSDVEALDQVYAWVVTNIDYDYEEAVTVASGYLPAIDEVYETRMGICFDYAVLTAAMLRSQRIPAQLVVGYAGSAYHAWIEVHCADTGEIGMYVFNGEKWVQMDPTFDAASKGTQDLSSVIGDGNNYQPLFYY
ncbi:MAG: transglutaminase-like domain-containing protein [Coriobacteriales bacterium]|nr:transglutaminase-like domain-containing protein [Coriobacteriales bacterium]